MAKTLLKAEKPSPAGNPAISSAIGKRAETLEELANQGFSPRDIIREVRDLYDNTDDAGTKKQLLELVIKVQGMMSEEKVKEAPTFVLNIMGSREKTDLMLCPPHAESVPPITVQ